MRIVDNNNPVNRLLSKRNDDSWRGEMVEIDIDE